MKKVIAVIPPNYDQVLTTEATAKKNNWWITYHAEVVLQPKEHPSSVKHNQVPRVGLLMLGIGMHIYKLSKVDPVHKCYTCGNSGNNRIETRFYCTQHFKKLTITKPIVGTGNIPQRNAPCRCGSGKKYKRCCLPKDHHSPRHYFNSLYKRQKTA